MYRLTHFLLLIVLLSGCSRCGKHDQKKDLVRLPQLVNEHVNTHLEELLAELDSTDKFVLYHDSIIAPDWVRLAYEIKEFKPLWTSRAQILPATDSLIKHINSAWIWGLNPEEYHRHLIDSLYKGRVDNETGKYDAMRIAELEILLTDAFYKMAVHVSKGRIMPDTLIVNRFKRNEINFKPEELLKKFITTADLAGTFRPFEPKHKSYHLTKEGVKEFFIRFAHTNWDSIPPRDKDPGLYYSRLKARLAAWNLYDSTAGTNDSVRISAAVKRFQEMRGLEADGKVGKFTLKALNQKPKDYLKQFAVNLERWRVEPDSLPVRYVWVNIPEYRMRLIDSDTVFLESRVVVGAPKTQTPELKSTIRYFTLYPFWNVPFSIATKEMIPIVQKDTSYLRKKNFEVLDRKGNIVDPTTLDWKRFNKNYFPYRFRQREGEDNSLGILKFQFHNKHGVYMHDTNSKNFFGKEVRAFSHGCIRLEKFKELAEYLITPDTSKIPVDSLRRRMNEKIQRTINLSRPVRIYTKYYTAVPREGKVVLHLDIYGRDEEYWKLLFKS